MVRLLVVLESMQLPDYLEDKVLADYLVGKHQIDYLEGKVLLENLENTGHPGYFGHMVLLGYYSGKDY